VKNLSFNPRRFHPGRLALSNFGNLFGAPKEGKSKELVDLETLYAQIGHQKVEVDFLKSSCYEVAHAAIGGCRSKYP